MQINTLPQNNQLNFTSITSSCSKLPELMSKRMNTSAWAKYEKLVERAAKNKVVNVDLFVDEKGNLNATLAQTNPHKFGWLPHTFKENPILKHITSPVRFIEKKIKQAEKWGKELYYQNTEMNY